MSGKGILIQIKTATKSPKLRMRFDINSHTVYDVKKAYCDQEAQSMKPEKLNLYKGKKELVGDNNTLKAAGVTRSTVLNLTVKLVGGAQYVPNSKILNNKRNRKLDTSDPEIKTSHKPDCIYYYTDIPRAEMPCGHAFCPQTMFDLAKSVITKNEYEFEFKCPAGKCGVEFDFDLVAKVADMNDDEYLYFMEEIARRSMPETQECPNCAASCERPDDLKKFRVNCPACNGGDWCWLCAGKWLGGGFSLCGNKGCPSTEINEVLATCPLKNTTYTDENGKYVQVPKIRACTKCLEFIEHSDLCKHMTCQLCGNKFCFSCLKGVDGNGNWQCGSVGYQCTVAARQKLN